VQWVPKLPVMPFLIALLTLGAAVAQPTRAEDGSFDDILGGFDEEEGDEDYFAGEDETDSTILPSWMELSGHLALAATYNYLPHYSTSGTYYGNISMLRTKLFLQSDFDLPGSWQARASGFVFYDFAYLIHGRENYTDEVLDFYEWDGELQEFWVEGALAKSLDTKIGRQVVNWGRSESLRVVDVLNPLDNRYPGLQDLEDIYRPIGMAKFDYWIDRWGFSAMIIPEIRYDKQVPYGSDWFPALTIDSVLEPLEQIGLSPRALQIGGEAFVFPDDRPAHWGEEVELAGAITGIFQGWDISVYAAHYIANAGRAELTPQVFDLPNENPPPASIPIEFFTAELVYDELTMVGAGGNLTFGSWLLKAETAYIHGLGFSTGTLEVVEPFPPTPLTDPWTSFTVEDTEKNRIDVMGGIEYYGISDLTLSLEIVNRHIFDYEDKLIQFPNFVRKNTVEVAMRATYNMLNDRLDLTAVGIMLGIDAKDGALLRMEANYDIIDALELKGGILIVWDGELPILANAGRNDRLFMRLKYSF